MNEYIYCIQPARLEMLSDGATPREAELVGMHFAYLETLLAAGTLILAGRTQDTGADSFGVIIFRSVDDEAARQVVARDPAVREGVFVVHLHPYKVALMESRGD
jgi:uncharacterized protein